MNYIDTKAKCHLEKITCKGALWQVFYLLEAPSAPMTSYSPPLTHCIRVYGIPYLPRISDMHRNFGQIERFFRGFFPKASGAFNRKSKNALIKLRYYLYFKFFNDFLTYRSTRPRIRTVPKCHGSATLPVSIPGLVYCMSHRVVVFLSFKSRRTP